jgi:maltooligosyltrehalose trehalohydrolase
LTVRSAGTARHRDGQAGGHERAWHPGIGAWPEDGAWCFRVWAPDAGEVELVSVDGGTRTLAPAADGYFEARCPHLQAGELYRYRLDGRGPFPDPASRSQPQGVHGPSQLVDPAMFPWTDAGWQGVALPDLVIYELHVGTFSPEGTFAGAIARLPVLTDLGVTAIELMPVASFPGARNWGYDGAALFAPDASYGGPDGLRALVDAAHGRGIAVLLDVVYNHFGPDGAYQTQFARRYVAEAPGAWGHVPNLREEGHEEVRAFYVDNALHWLHEYHLDGLRLDATHAFVDAGARPFLDELVASVRAAAPRPVLLIAEDDRNERRLIEPAGRGGAGLDGVWADDIHHQVRVAVAGDRDGYYADYDGSASAIADAIGHGWFYRGAASALRGRPRGTATDGLPLAAFVACLQNHDQIGNRAFGDRLHHVVDLAAWRALSVLLLSLPETPLLFMGQEWAATSPFQYFTDHPGELGEAVDRGRRAEFARFAAFGDGREIPAPQAESTFARSRLAWAELATEPHRSIWRLYRDAIACRRAHLIAPLAPVGSVAARAPDPDAVVVEGRGRDGCRYACVCRLRGAGPVRYRPGPLAHGPEPDHWGVALSSEDALYAQDPVPVGINPRSPHVELVFGRPGAVVLVGRGSRPAAS